MNDAEGQPDDERNGPHSTGIVERTRSTLDTAASRARSAGEQHVSVAVPFRAAERNRRVAASVLSGGIAYRVFIWLLPLGLVLGGVLGLGDAESMEDAVEAGGIPAAIVNAVGDAARASESDWWWLLAIGVPLLLWAGYTGAKALQLIHALVWEEPPPRAEPLKSSLVFTSVGCVFVVAAALAWYLRDEPWFVGPVAVAVTIGPLAGLWLWTSLHLPHGSASWKHLVPGALLVAVGFQALHAIVIYFLAPKLEKSTSLYGDLGIVATVLFFMYVAGRLVVTAPILNSSLHAERRKQSVASGHSESTRAPASPG